MKKQKNITDMSELSLHRHGYIDKEGFFTEKAYQRMTDEDHERLHDNTMDAIERRQTETEEIANIKGGRHHTVLGFEFESKDEADDFFEDYALGDK